MFCLLVYARRVFNSPFRILWFRELRSTNHIWLHAGANTTMRRVHHELVSVHAENMFLLEYHIDGAIDSAIPLVLALLISS